MYVFPKWGKYPDSLFNYDQENLVLWMIGCLIIGGLFISVLSNRLYYHNNKNGKPAFLCTFLIIVILCLFNDLSDS